jgi:hypothetical protein
MAVVIGLKYDGMAMSEIIFLVEEDLTGGLTARGLGVGIFTQADTRAELDANVREAVALHFEGSEDRPKVIRLNLDRDGLLERLFGR